jgi:glycerol kinase
MKVALGIDVGTTGIKSMLVSETGHVLACETREQHQFFPHPGWVEQDPRELIDLCLDSFQALLTKSALCARDVACLGLDHQGESCLVWDKASGAPLYPVITWQDRRMAAVSEEYGKRHGAEIERLTGLRSDSYYSAWKIRWVLDHVKDGQARAENGELLAGTLNTWLFWNFSGRKAFVTDESSADVMMLCDPRVTGWNEWLLDLMRIPKHMLAQILPCDEVLGFTDRALFGAEIPITASLADCSAGIVASGAVQRGDLTVTYGTGNFLHLIVGDTYVAPRDGLTASCSYADKVKHVYQLNGICYTAGSAIKWLKHGLGLIRDEAEAESLANSVEDTAGVYFVPALNGLATPWWDQTARGAFLGVTAASTRAHVVRAVLESSALQVANCSRIMQQVSGLQPGALHAMGGMTSNSFLMQLQADLCGFPVSLPLQTEPAYGSACMALSGLGFGPAIEQLKTLNPPVREYHPRMSESQRNDRVDSWLYAAQRAVQWHPDDIRA